MTSSPGRRLFGFGVLFLTVVSGYVASRLPVTPEGPQVSNAPAGLASHIKAASTRHGVSEELIAAVIEVESEFNPRAVSRKGARGLMQLMPATAACLGVNDPFDPRQNIDGGVRHLRGLMDRFDHNLPLALAAYNAGEQAVIVHGGVPPYRQTREYVTRILRLLNRNTASTPDAGQHGRRA